MSVLSSEEREKERLREEEVLTVFVENCQKFQKVINIHLASPLFGEPRFRQDLINHLAHIESIFHDLLKQDSLH